MRLAIVGHGRMGRAVERVAAARGHEVGAIVTPPGGGGVVLESAMLDDVDVAVEFTTPDAARDVVMRLLARGVATVSGTTGWDDAIEDARAASRASGTPFLWAPNFSLGMQVLYRLAREAARSFAGLGGYSPWLHETHHAAKRDAPSGSARRLAELVLEETPQLDRFAPAPRDAALAPGTLSVSWTRAGHVPGRHELGWDGVHESLRLEHDVRDRTVFAAGAVRAAEWLAGRTGPQTLDDMVDDLMKAGPR